MDKELEEILNQVTIEIKSLDDSLNTNQKKIIVYRKIAEKLKNKQYLLKDTSKVQKYIYEMFLYSKLIPPIGTMQFLDYSLVKRESLRGYDNALIEENYNKILKTYYNLAKELNVSSSIDLSILFSILLWKGYFSENKKYIYSKKNRIYEEKNYQVIIMDGHGVCLEIAKMLNDFLKACSEDSSILMCYADPKKININNPKLVRRLHDNTAYENKKNNNIRNKLSELISKQYIGNHAVNIIKNSDEIILYDATSNCILKVINEKEAEIINGEGLYKMFPFTSIQLSYNDIDVNLLKKIFNNSQTKLKEEDFLLSLNTIKYLFIDNKNLIDDVYDEVHNNIENISDEIYNNMFNHVFHKEYKNR